jgi:hypothetical protein
MSASNPGQLNTNLAASSLTPANAAQEAYNEEQAEINADEAILVEKQTLTAQVASFDQREDDADTARLQFILEGQANTNDPSAGDLSILNNTAPAPTPPPSPIGLASGASAPTTTTSQSKMTNKINQV